MSYFTHYSTRPKIFTTFDPDEWEPVPDYVAAAERPDVEVDERATKVSLFVDVNDETWQLVYTPGGGRVDCYVIDTTECMSPGQFGMHVTKTDTFMVPEFPGEVLELAGARRVDLQSDKQEGGSA